MQVQYDQLRRYDFVAADKRVIVASSLHRMLSDFRTIFVSIPRRMHRARTILYNNRRDICECRSHNSRIVVPDLCRSRSVLATTALKVQLLSTEVSL